MPRKEDLEKYAKRAIENTTEPNRTTLRRFIDQKHVSGIKLNTLSKYAVILHDLDEAAKGKPFAELTGEDLTAYLVAMKRRQLSHKTIVHTATVLRSFLRRILEVDTLPRGLRTSLEVRDKRGIPKVAPISHAEYQKLWDACGEDWRYRCLLAVLSESGFRNSELTSLNIGSVDFCDDGSATLALPEDAPFLKTGPRTICVVRCVPVLKAWITLHPATKNRNAPLFPSQRNKSGLTRLGTQNVDGFFHKLYTRAGTRPIWPHLFRHTRATELARLGWNESQMRAYLGWAWNSQMPAYYTHLVAQDMKERILQDAGLKPRGPGNPDPAPAAPQPPMPPAPPPAPAAVANPEAMRGLNALADLMEVFKSMPRR